MPKVCFDLSAAVQQSAGISRYEAQLAQALVALDGPEAYSIFYTSPSPLTKLSLAPALQNLPQRGLTISNKVWRLKLLAAYLTRRKYDQLVLPKGDPAYQLFHGMDYIVPPLKMPSVVTVYDLSFLLYPQLHSRYNRLYLRLALPICLPKTNRIIVISESTQRDLIKWLPKVADRISIVPGGVSDESYFEDLASDQTQEVLARYGLLKQPYLLSVGTIEPRKNQARLVEAYAGLCQLEEQPPALVLVGRKGWGDEYTRIVALTKARGLTLLEDVAQVSQVKAGQVLILTRVGDTDLKVLYQQARVVCYPSIYEGFGLPALEALAAGTPLITSNNSSIPEITGLDGETALLIDPYDVKQLTQRLQNLLHDEALRQRIKQAGRTRARLFTWRRAAELTRQVYRELG